MAAKVKCFRCKRVRKAHQCEDRKLDNRWIGDEVRYRCLDREACFAAEEPKIRKQWARWDRNRPLGDPYGDVPDPSIDLAALLIGGEDAAEV